MTLRGSLGDFPLETIIQLLSATEKTGALEVRSAQELGALGFDKGRLVSAATGDDVGEPALGMVFTMGGGEFEFTPWDDAPAANLSGDLASLLDRAVEHRDRIIRDRTTVPHDRLRFVQSARVAQMGSVTLTGEQLRTLFAVNGERDVTAIAAHLGVGRLAALATLAELIRLGLIETTESPSGSTPPSAPPTAPPPLAASAIDPSPAAATPLASSASAPSSASEWGAVAAPAPIAPPSPAVETVSAETAPAPPSWDSASPVTAEPAAEPQVDRLAWMTPKTQEPAADPPAATPAKEWHKPATSEWGTSARTWDTGLPTQSWEGSAPAPAAPAQSWGTPTATPAEDALNEQLAARIAALGGTPAQGPADDRLVALSGTAALEAPTELDARPTPAFAASDAMMPTAAASAAVPVSKKRGGLFGLFGGKDAEPAAAAATAGASAATTALHQQVWSRGAKMAYFANALLGEYNSGRHGKGRVDDRMSDLLMRVDEQADPIDRPIPVLEDRIDVLAFERASITEAQAAPYLARLISLIHADAARVLGKDKAKKGYRAAQGHVFGADAGALAGPDVAGKLPKI